MPNYDDLTLEQLDALIIELSNSEAPKDERLAATRAYDRAYQKAEIERRLKGLGDLDQTVLAEFIAGEEKVSDV